MPVLSSAVASTADNFRDNRSDMLELIDHWRSLEQRSIDASNKRLATFRARGQLSPRGAFRAPVRPRDAVYPTPLDGQLLR